VQNELDVAGFRCKVSMLDAVPKTVILKVENSVLGAECIFRTVSVIVVYRGNAGLLIDVRRSRSNDVKYDDQ
jgi:hypothetical protein